LYFSVWGLLKKGANALGGAIGLAAAAFVGFDALADPNLAGTPAGNSESTLLWLAVLYSIVPAGFKFIALPFIWNYPLTEERQKRIRERLERRGRGCAGEEFGVSGRWVVVPAVKAAIDYGWS
jgi:Na+/melibiose symporter-like transporter